MITPEQLASNNSEHGHQAALFCWAQQNQSTCPQLKWLFAVPNGFFGSAGQKAKMKAEGLKLGVPDIFLLYPKWPKVRVNMPYCGLFIELKIPEKKRATNLFASCSDEQKEWLTHLQAVGYCVHVCYGWLEARDRIVEYLEN